MHRLARSEVVPPGSSLVEIDLIEQPDGTLPAPDPHTPAQCRVAVACALEATINKIRNRNPRTS